MSASFSQGIGKDPAALANEASSDGAANRRAHTAGVRGRARARRREATRARGVTASQAASLLDSTRMPFGLGTWEIVVLVGFVGVVVLVAGAAYLGARAVSRAGRRQASRSE